MIENQHLSDFVVQCGTRGMRCETSDERQGTSGKRQVTSDVVQQRLFDRGSSLCRPLFGIYPPPVLIIN